MEAETRTEKMPILVAIEVWDHMEVPDATLAITGSLPLMGNWLVESALPLELHAEGHWKCEVLVDEKTLFEWKIVSIRNKGQTVVLEEVPNRTVCVPSGLHQARLTDTRTGLRILTVAAIFGEWENYASPCTHCSHVTAENPLPPRRTPNNLSRRRSVLGTPKPCRSDQESFLPKQYGFFPPMYPGRSRIKFPDSCLVQSSPVSTDTIRLSSDLARLKSKHRLLKVTESNLMEDVSHLTEQLNRATKKHKSHTKNIEKGHKVAISALQNSFSTEQAELKKSLQNITTEGEILVQQVSQLTAQNNQRLQECQELKKKCEEEVEKRLASVQQLALEAELKETKLTQAHEDESRELRTKTAELETRTLELQHNLKGKEALVHRLSEAISGFAASIPNQDLRKKLLNRSIEVEDRIGLVLEYVEREARKFNPATYQELLNVCSALRQDMALQKDMIRQDFERELQNTMSEAERALTLFVNEQEREKEVYIERYYKQYYERRKLANDIIDLKGKIRVFGRARPMIDRELELGHRNVCAFPEENRLLIGLDAQRFLLLDSEVKDGVLTQKGENKIEDVKTYILDHIFGPDSTQEEVFEEVEHVISSVLEGYNVTVFAYGQTGSGKTFTMDGTADNPGLTYRSLSLFFDIDTSKNKYQKRFYEKIRKLKPKVDVSISMVEIYNESITDLLSTELKGRDKLEVRQSPDGGSYIPGLSTMDAYTIEDAIDIMDLGRENRKTASTKMNVQSSRSHMVFTAHVTVTHPMTKDKVQSKLHLVDLAGSERVSKTMASGEQLKEAQHINKSLSALGDVIASLTQKGSSNRHVPYRNSKLTFLLQDSLCGHSRTAMFVNISPSSDNYWESISTLNFGARAASVELGEVQKKFESGETGRLRDMVNKLQDELRNTRASSSHASGEMDDLKRQVSELTKELDQSDRKIRILSKQNDELQEQTSKEHTSVEKIKERSRMETREKEDRIKELEEQVKTARKSSVHAAKHSESDRELALVRKELAELTSKLKQAENRVAVAERKSKKAEKDLEKSNQETDQARHALRQFRTNAQTLTVTGPEEDSVSISSRPRSNSRMNGTRAESTPRLGGGGVPSLRAESTPRLGGTRRTTDTSPRPGLRRPRAHTGTNMQDVARGISPGLSKITAIRDSSAQRLRAGTSTTSHQIPRRAVSASRAGRVPSVAFRSNSLRTGIDERIHSDRREPLPSSSRRPVPMMAPTRRKEQVEDPNESFNEDKLIDELLDEPFPSSPPVLRRPTLGHGFSTHSTDHSSTDHDYAYDIPEQDILAEIEDYDEA